MTETASISQKSLKLISKGIAPRDPAESPVNDRFGNLPGYQPGTMSRLHVILVGAGGLGGEIGQGMVRNGVGQITVCDPDIVELSNLNRQRFFAEDLYQNKALRLVRNLHKEAIMPLTLVGLAMSIENAIDTGFVKTANAIICGVDSQKARVYTARWGVRNQVPVIFTAINNNADFGYIFVQTSRRDEPCFGCVFPDAVHDQNQNPCVVGSSIDILKTVAGPVLYALGALFMQHRPLTWRYKEISLSGTTTDGIREIPRRHNCSICTL